MINLIFIAFCAVLCGAEDWVSITRFGKARFNWLSRFLDLTNGIPSHDTFNRVFAIYPSDLEMRRPNPRGEDRGAHMDAGMRRQVVHTLNHAF